jgi:hypothetical protein
VEASLLDGLSLVEHLAVVLEDPRALADELQLVERLFNDRRESLVLLEVVGVVAGAQG